MFEKKIWLKLCGIFCSVCKIDFNKVEDLKRHIQTKDHEERRKKFCVECQEVTVDPVHQSSANHVNAERLLKFIAKIVEKFITTKKKKRRRRKRDKKKEKN